MKRLIMFALPLLLVVGISNAQSPDEWTSGITTYSTGGDTIPPSTTITSYAVDMRKAMTIREDPNTVEWHQARATTAYMLPRKLSLQFVGIETFLSDSLIHYKGIKFANDTTYWTDVVQLDTLLSYALHATLGDTNATVSEWHVLDLADFPDFRYFSIVTASQATADTSTALDKYGLRYEK